MEMIRHKAPGKDVAIRLNMISDFSKEKQVVFAIIKNHLPVVSLVVNVINAAGFEVHSIFVLK